MAAVHLTFAVTSDRTINSSKNVVFTRMKEELCRKNLFWADINFFQSVRGVFFDVH